MDWSALAAHATAVGTVRIRTEAAPGRGALRVEQGFALLHWFRRLRIRWEIRDDTREAFLELGCALICWRRVQTTKS